MDTNPNPFDVFDDDEDAGSLVALTRPIPGPEAFGSAPVKPLREPNPFDRFDEDRPPAPAALPSLSEMPGVSWTDDPQFNDALSRFEAMNRRDGQEAIAKAKASRPWGTLTHEGQKAWLVESRKDAEADLKQSQQDIARTYNYLTENAETLDPRVRGVMTRNLETSQSILAKSQKKLQHLDDVEAGRAPLPTLTGLRSGVENVGQGLVDDVAASIVKAAGLTAGYLGRAAGSEDLPENNAIYRVGHLEICRGAFPRRQGSPAGIQPGAGARRRKYDRVLWHGWRRRAAQGQ